ncbi:hypothetical protein SUGI_0180910 [Cryptomeria japonica]|uniref:protein kinase STUNTED n=1 Tax=Cryptomeria japonica TaxID=3369 RepID=UPI002408B398|nr:protein kinase STUNTED [Cryptomeria japonica]XP_059072707.1 protein kinase STUNTED [Cryptomeria japonica]GLJ11954.1 hypothetical protein SUGI_0180910 [Cryptomeria japonica]
MKVEKGVEKKGRTLVVGVKLATASREVLTWTLMKVARPGDHVIAVHAVTSSPNDLVVSRGSQKGYQQFASNFDAIIGVYETVCNLKEVGLKVKISHGPVRKVLLEETKYYNASKLILGTSKHNALVSPISLAKYCAQRLPSTSSVVVIDHGKVAFEKDGTLPISGIVSVCKSLCVNENPPDTTTSSPQDSDSDAQDRQEEQHTESQTDGSENLLSSTESFQMVESHVSERVVESDVSNKISVGGEETRSSHELPEKLKLSRSTTEPVSREKPSFRSSFLRIESSPGWPLRRVVSMDKILTPRSNAREMSVVEWALNLPGKRKQAITEGTINECGEFESPDQLSSKEIHKDKIEPGMENLSLTEKLKLICKIKSCKEFAYKVLQSATSNFSSGNLIGKGGCSRVYKGVLPDGKPVAVKFLNIIPEAEQELFLEVEIMLVLQHKNIVSLIGYCMYGQERLLVYNLMPRGNLEENLHVRKDNVVIAWKERLKVAIGVAKALDYLHDGCPRSIIHRDVKSSNILLSENFEPQLSDFGLAKWAPTSSSCTICNDVSGTFGYLAPEYFMYGRVNAKTDIYSFGVVLLELITGKRPIHTRDPNHNESLVKWARPLLEEGSIGDLVDPILENDYDEREMQRMVLAAALCIRKAPRFRPRMSQILKLLEGEGNDPVKWARHQLKMSKYIDNDTADDEDGENNESLDIQTHLSLAMLGVDDDVESFDSSNQSSSDLLKRIKSWEEFLDGQLSR